MAKPIEVARTAPLFALSRLGRRSLASRDLNGPPWVLAFVRGWSADPDRAGELQAIHLAAVG